MLHTTKKLLPALVLGALSGTASAAGFQLMEQSASGLGNAFAGSAAVAENASTIYYNPAGMTQLQGRNASIGANFIDLSAKYTNKPRGATSLPAQAVDGGDDGLVPNGYLSYQLNDKWWLGIGIGAPFGMRTNYQRGWTGSVTAMDTDIKSMNINPSVAYKVNDAFSVGFGLDYMKFKATYSQNAGALGVLTVKGDDTAWGWNAGALWNLSERTRLGLSYRSEIKQNLTGNYTTSTPFNGAAGLNLTLPETWILSAYHKLNDRVELLADVSQTGWSSVPEILIKVPTLTPVGGQVKKPYHWGDTLRVALGANYAVNDAFKLRFGVAFDEGVVSDQYRTARLPDQKRTWLTVGAQYKTSKDSAIDVGYAYIASKTASVHDPVAGTPLYLDGEFKSKVQVLGAQYSFSF
ncbi:MAG TPA: outer membrane protein transport protein [Azospira sp.]|nr:outer membrane protein transport protein [Azospira sp.]